MSDEIQIEESLADKFINWERTIWEPYRRTNKADAERITTAAHHQFIQYTNLYGDTGDYLMGMAVALSDIGSTFSQLNDPTLNRMSLTFWNVAMLFWKQWFKT